MDRFLRHIEQPSTSILICCGIICGCLISVFYMDNWQLPGSLALLVLVSSYFKLFSNVLAGFILGIFVTVLHYQLFYQLSWKNLVVDKPVKITAQVTQIIKAGKRPYIQVDIKSIDKFQVKSWQKVYANLSADTDSIKLQEGDMVAGIAKLKTFRSRKNLYGFNTELYAFRNYVHFKGRLKVTFRVGDTNALQDKYRHFVLDTFGEYKFGWLYYVLMTGDKSLIPKKEKEHFRMLGLSHLLAISGLHIAIFFSLSFLLIKTAVYPFKDVVAQSINIHIFGLVCALVLAGGYVVLSGMQVSAQRAWFMTFIGVLCYVMGARVSYTRSLTYALTVILLISPFTLLNLGLYFSFAAVASILWLLAGPVSHKSFEASWTAKCAWFFKIQLLLFLTLSPLMIFAFQGISLSGVVVNLIAIPLLSCVIFPALLFQIMVAAGYNIQLMSQLDHLIYLGYQWLTNLDYNWLEVGYISATQAALIMLILLMLSHVLIRAYAVIPMIVLIAHKAVDTSPPWQINIFDVGHGSAILVEHQGKGFLYDLGANYFGTYSMFEKVILPYLRARDIQLVHTIVSHDDGDHAGGLPDLVKFSFEKTLNAFHGIPYRQPCGLKEITFGQLTIRSIWPSERQNDDNNSSCVVVVDDGKYKLLLPGDIESATEKKLTARYGEQLDADFLLAPHHGSRTSSSLPFVRAVGAKKTVIFSRSHNTAWQLPHQQILKRYLDAEYEIYDTALDGQIQIRVFSDHFEVYTARNAKNLWFLR
ncbi:DNA internalization-related competence protein ComEC/Rec2 [Pseudoalteromonas luteoviolacea]|uniref:DNA internalization-related competence protein ComEC/Rec2 n=1 Tax=Pseudoalteromonas luteoviolacea TaxID=43657 RepID=UPI0032B4555A